MPSDYKGRLKLSAREPKNFKQ